MPGIFLCIGIPGMVNIGQLIANGGPSARNFSQRLAASDSSPHTNQRESAVFGLDILYAVRWVILSQYPSSRSRKHESSSPPEAIFHIFLFTVSDETHSISLEIYCCPVYNSNTGGTLASTTVFPPSFP